MDLVDSVLYTPEQVSENGWLGWDTTPGAIRKAASRGEIEFTRFRGRIYLTRSNITAIHATGLEQAKADRASQPAPSRRGRRASTSVAVTPSGVTPLRARPDAARRRRAS